MRISQKISTIITVAFITCLSISVSAYELKDLLPNDVDVIFRIDNIDSFKKDFDKTSMGRLLNDPKFQKFAKGFHFANIMSADKPEEFREMMKKALEQFDGEFIFSLKPKTKSVYVVFQSDAKKFDEFMKFQKKLSELNKTESEFRREDFRGVPIHIEITEKKGKIENTCFALVNGVAISSESSDGDRAWLEKTIAKLTKEAPKSDKNSSNVSLTLKPSLISSLTEAGEKEPKGEDAQAVKKKQKTARILKELGLSGIGAKIVLKPSERSLCLESNVFGIPAERPGLWSLFDFGPAPKKSNLPYIPAQVNNYGAFRFNVKKLSDNLPKLIQAIDPGIWFKLSGGLLMAQGQLGFSLYDGLALPLGTQWVWYDVIEKDNVNFLMSVDLKDEKKLRESLDLLLNGATTAQFLKSEDFLNHKIISFSNPNMPPTPTPSQNPMAELQKNFNIMVADGALYLGHPDLLRQTARALNNPKKGDGVKAFYQSKFYRELMEMVPDEATMYELVAVKKGIEMILDKFEEDGNDPSGAPGPGPKFGEFLEKIFSEVNYANKPSAEYVASFFGNSVQILTFKNGSLNFKVEFFNPKKKDD